MRRMLSDDSGSENVIDDDKNDIKAFNNTVKPVVNNSIDTDKIGDKIIAKEKTSVTVDSKKDLNIAPKKDILKDNGTNKNITLPHKRDINNIQPSIETKKENKNVKELKTTPGLPSGWQKMVDQTSGKVYYIDHNTKTTHWVLPDGITDKNFSTPKTITRPKQIGIQQPPMNGQKRKDDIINGITPNGNLISPGTNMTPSSKPIDGSGTSVGVKLPKNTVPAVVAPKNPPSTASTIDPSIGPVLKPPQQFSNPEIPSVQKNMVQSPKAATRPTQQPKQIQQPQKPNIPTPPKQSDIPGQLPQVPTASKPSNKPTISVQSQPLVPQENIKPQNVPTVPSIPKQKKPHLSQERKIPPASQRPKETMDVPKQPSLKRSLSSPNLAENLANIKANKPKTPIVDRGSKPL